MKTPRIVVVAALALLGSGLTGCGTAVAPGTPTRSTTSAAHDAAPSYESLTAAVTAPAPHSSASRSSPPTPLTTADSGAPTVTPSPAVRRTVAYPFDGPPVIDETWMIGWGDSMIFDDDFVMTEPDDGRGHWQHRQLSSGCLIDFWQVKNPTESETGGDRAMSDLLLAHVSGLNRETISAAAGDDMLSVTIPGGPHTFQTRSIYGFDRNSGEALLFEARFFSGAAAGVAIGLRCPEGVDLSDSRKVPLLAEVALTIVGG